MAVSKEKKDEILKSLVKEMKEAKSVVFADFQGLSVKDLKEIRSSLREKGVKFQVAKKTLLKIAAKEAGYTEVSEDAMIGPVGAALSMEDEIIAAKLLYQFAKKNENLKLRGALLNGQVLGQKEVKDLALIPSHEELIAKFVYLIKSPISGFHGVLYNTMAGFVRTLNAIKEKQEKAA